MTDDETNKETATLMSKEEAEEEPAPTSAASSNKRKRKRKRKSKQNKADDGDDDGDGDDKVENRQGNIGDPLQQPTDDEESKKVQQVHRTVFVEGIPFACTPEQVRAFFVQHLLGEAHDTDDDNEDCIVDLRLPVWHDSGRLRGYGHVVFQTLEQYDKALQLSGKYLQNRYLTIQPAQAPKGGGASKFAKANINHSNPSATLSVHNLSYEACEDDVRHVMAKYGDICEGGVRIVRHSQTGRSKGFGYVQYADKASAQKAIKASTAREAIEIAGRTCRLDYDHGRVRGSFRTADRKLWHKEYKRPRHGEYNEDERR